MTGLSVAMTAIALPPRRERASFASRSRTRLMARLRRPDQQLAVGVAADAESQEVEALIEVDDPRLVLVEGQPPRRQPLREPRPDMGGLLLAVAEHDHVVGVPDRDRGPWLGGPGLGA